MRLVLSGYGEHLGARHQGFLLKGRSKEERIPFQKMKQLVLTPGNSVSTDSLFWACTYGVDTLIMSNTGRLLGLMVPTGTHGRVETRIAQYKAYESPKRNAICRAILDAGIANRIWVASKHGIDTGRLRVISPESVDTDYRDARRYCVAEARFARSYFREIIKLVPEWLKPRKRSKYMARDPFNNLLNLGYEVLKAEVYRAILYAHLDPYLGFMHSVQKFKPSLVCDLQDVFRGFVDDYILDHVQKLDRSMFVQTVGRMYLRQEEAFRLIDGVNGALGTKYPYERRGYSKKCSLRTIIREEAIQLAKYLREGRNDESFSFLGIRESLGRT